MSGYSQEKRYGLPGIRNYPRSEYNGGTQNWSVGQAENGKMYFSNNDGLLEFDGVHWELYREMGILNRSLCIDGKRIYVGANNKIGYYEENKEGRLKYYPLNALLQSRIYDFEDIWRIYKTSFGIVFQSFKAIFIYKDNKIDIIYPRSKFHLSYYVNGILWVNDEKEGLMQYREGKVHQIPGGELFSGTEIWTILPLNDDQIIIGTANKGLFRYDSHGITRWEKPVNELLKKYQIFSGALISPGYLAFGTIQNGLIISDTTGRVMFEIDKERGILNNTVLSIGSDREGDLWLGLDNGISVVHFNSPVTYIQDYFDIGSGYTSVRYGEYLYLGTNQGLFYIKWSDFLNPLKEKEDFHLINGTEGQVWSLSLIDNDLLCGHNFGIFQIRGSKAIRISSIPGCWNFRTLTRKKSFLMVGHYSGLSLFEKKGNLWCYRNDLQGFSQSSRYFEEDSQGDIWVSHDYKGIYRLQPDSSWKEVKKVILYDSSQGLPPMMNNRIFKLKSDLVAVTRNGIYQFDEKNDHFVKDTLFTRLLSGYTQFDYINQDQWNNIWYFNNRQPGVLMNSEDGSLKNITDPFFELRGKIIPAFGHINIIDRDNVLIGIEGGFAHYTSLYRKNNAVNLVLYISSLKSRDSTEGIYRFDNTGDKQEIVPGFRFKNNTISIAFASDNYEAHETYFQYKLENFDEKWSDWSTRSFKEYTNLHEGRYTFMLQAKCNGQEPCSTLYLTFRILPPWYRSTVAWIAYSVLSILIFFAIQIFVRRSIRRLRQKEKEAHLREYLEREQKLKEEALVAEKEMIRLRNEKLNLEMIHKEKELANNTMLLIRKNNLLNKLKADLNGIMRSQGKDEPKLNFAAVIRQIEKDMDNEKQWQVFNSHIEQVYEELLYKLKENYPDLTPRELKLCAFLRMNISSKEISSLMNISPRGVEISRYRIRKKLKLDRYANLTEFILNL
jgi:DNA-binding CsgD family transcriptional regulator/ligand-binding sensor domain-containing protein